MAVSTSAPEHAVGSLVHARGRDWVVLPSDDRDILRLRPLTGGEADAVGLFLPLEKDLVSSAEFQPPDPSAAGDAAGGLLLRDAARLAIRNGAAPFRSLGRIAVQPRPYQFVPLIMALRLDPVRLLIADDVGVGKTVEAAMIAREMLDRGLAKRLAVLCPPHLCEQWQTELRDKFAIEAAVVQPATMGRLERALPRADLNLYGYYPHLILSIDFVKFDRHRVPFLQNAPDLVIVDEAHMGARPPGQTGQAQQQRFQLVRALADDPNRHLVLVSATPHSGIEESFRSVLGLLDTRFDAGDETAELDRRALVPHLVQRRRADLQNWLGADTPFPERRAEERAYSLSPEYQALYTRVLEYCRESIRSDGGMGQRQQRVRHWAAIALLRCVLSSPDAAAAVLGERARRQGYEEAPFDSIEEMDAAYRAQVLDPIEEGDSGDYAPTAPLEEMEPQLDDAERRKLGAFLRQARALAGPANDAKLAEAAAIVRGLLRDGFHPIIFCRFIATAKYLADWLPKLLGKEVGGLEVQAVTGEIPDEVRRERVAELLHHPVRLLVATDCLSEGINLQEGFDAVVHYDLPWNPNRLEQREGRVDRFGQQRPEIRTVVLYGADNDVDMVVRDVLIRKARAIRRQLGIAVPVPAESDRVVQAVVDTVLLRMPQGGDAQLNPGLEGSATQLGLGLELPEVSRLHREWDRAAEREGRQRAFFAQRGIQPDEVAREIEATDPVLGDASTVRYFLGNAVQRLGGELRPLKTGAFELIAGAEMAGRIAGGNGALEVRFDTGGDGAAHLTRTHPLVAAYCDAVLGKALAPGGDRRFARCGALYTDAVDLRTAVVLLRMRYLLKDRAEEYAEEVITASITRRSVELLAVARGAPADPISGDGLFTEPLLERARPTANMPPEERQRQIVWALDHLAANPAWYRPLIDRRVDELRAANARLRKLVRADRLEIVPRTPPDILGVYVLVPGGNT